MRCEVAVQLGQSLPVQIGQQSIPIQLGQNFAFRVCSTELEDTGIPGNALMQSEGVPILSIDGRYIIVDGWVAPGGEGSALIFDEGDNTFLLPLF